MYFATLKNSFFKGNIQNQIRIFWIKVNKFWTRIKSSLVYSCIGKQLCPLIYTVYGCVHACTLSCINSCLTLQLHGL